MQERNADEPGAGAGEDESDEGFEQRSVVVQRSVHDGEGTGSLSVTVVEALAEAKGVSPVDLETPLYDVVDPDALDRLFTGTDDGADGRVIFELADHEATVHASGEVLVRRRRE